MSLPRLETETVATLVKVSACLQVRNIALGKMISSGKYVLASGSLPLHTLRPKTKKDLLVTHFQYLFLAYYCSVEKLVHQRPNLIHFFFQCEMACVKKMELCTGNVSLKE